MAIHAQIPGYMLAQACAAVHAHRASQPSHSLPEKKIELEHVIPQVPEVA